MFYKLDRDSSVRCFLCPHNCRINDGDVGTCMVRRNFSGKLHSLVYGKVIAEHVDPIEKKPIFHYYPGSYAYSIATIGCNFKCSFCQNHDISQYLRNGGESLPGRPASPEDIVKAAMDSGCRSISYTYTEPTIFFEFAYDTARMAKAKGIGNNFVSNGYISLDAIETISPYLDAINIDLKNFNDETYKKINGGRLQPVLDAITKYKERGVWVEVTTLIVPGMNDSEEELREIARFLVKTDPNIPWHVSRFYPNYKMFDRNATPFEKIKKALQIGKEEGLNFVYSGNVPGWDSENTYCTACGTILIERFGFQSAESFIKWDRCPTCRKEVPGIGLSS
ncbi:MAG: AmmeMemoRadiSam system radical SAM enzyme [Acidobacteriota bacterium]